MGHIQQRLLKLAMCCVGLMLLMSASLANAKAATGPSTVAASRKMLQLIAPLTPVSD